MAGIIGKSVAPPRPGGSSLPRLLSAPLRREILASSRLLRFVLAGGSGLLLAASFPKASAGALAFVALAPLIAALVTSASSREGLLLGTFGYSVMWLINVPWVVNVMSKYGGLPYPLGVAIYVAMSIVLGLFCGVFFGIVVHRFHLRDALLPWLLIPCAWVAVEYARTYLLSGFPWDPLAAAIVDLRAFVQIDRWIGPYAVGFLLAAVSTLFAWLFLSGAPMRTKAWAGAGLLIGLIAWGAAGLTIVRSQDERIAAERKYTAALLQPNISQEMRWDDRTLADLFQRMSELTSRAAGTGAAVIVWPESTIPLTYATTEFYRDMVESYSRQANADIILGSVAQDAQDPRKVWNAAYIVSGGKTKGRYDKIRLVPFGEYVPLRKFLFFAHKLVREVGNFQFGKNDRPLSGRFDYGPAICYEVVFPQITASQVRHGANVLVTITNDAWFDHSAAPEQHLANARLRTIEDDRWLLRAATTGISALVDPTGRIVRSLPSWQEGMIIGGFAPRQGMTPYVRFGDWFAWVAIAGAGAGLLFRRRAGVVVPFRRARRANGLERR